MDASFVLDPVVARRLRLSIQTKPAVELRRLYVESSWHGKGVAQALMTSAIDEARNRSAAALCDVQRDIVMIIHLDRLRPAV